MAPSSKKPSCCLRLAAPQILALAAALALAILALVLMSDLPKRGAAPPASSPSEAAPSTPVPLQPQFMRLRR